MKKITLLLIAFAITHIALAQAYDGSVDYLKKSQAAVIAEYKHPQETVEKTLRDKLERLGLKVKSTKGFLVVYNALISSISNYQMEYAFQVDRKSKREKETTIIYMVMSANDVNTTAENASKAKDFLNELAPDIDALNVDNMVNDQISVVEKAQKKNKNLQDDIESLEKKIRNYQDDLAKTKRQQEEQVKEVARQQEILETIKAKRK
jgi:TolA-binding protein